MGFVITKGQMVDSQGFADAFLDCCLGGGDVEPREPAVRTYLVFLATEHLSNPLNGSGQVRLIKVLKPVRTTERYSSRCFGSKAADKGNPRSPTSDGLQYRETWLSSGSGSLIIEL